MKKGGVSTPCASLIIVILTLNVFFVPFANTMHIYFLMKMCHSMQCFYTTEAYY